MTKTDELIKELKKILKEINVKCGKDDYFYNITLCPKYSPNIKLQGEHKDCLEYFVNNNGFRLYDEHFNEQGCFLNYLRREAKDLEIEIVLVKK